jgi:hypothetical protein
MAPAHQMQYNLEHFNLCDEPFCVSSMCVVSRCFSLSFAFWVLATYPHPFLAHFQESLFAI